MEEERIDTRADAQFAVPFGEVGEESYRGKQKQICLHRSNGIIHLPRVPSAASL